MFSQFFINRPIFAAVLSIIITLAGGVARENLPIAQYPEITPPTVEVSAFFPGANGRTVCDTVAAPIEQQVNGVEDMLYMSSRSTNDGAYVLTVTFTPGTDLNIAQVLVQNRVNLAQPVLPDLVKRRGVTVKKKSPTVLMIINLFSPDGSKNDIELSNYATIQMRDELSRVSGVGDITYLGQRDYSMRIWLDPEKMAVRSVSSADVTHAIEEQNMQVAAGQIGQPPAPKGQVFQYTINTLGRLTTEEQFADIILRTDADGRVLRIRDVVLDKTEKGDKVKGVELGAINYDQLCTLDGKPSVALSVYQLPGTNAIATANRVSAKLAELKARFPKGVDATIVYNTTPFIEESVKEVYKTLLDAVVLVALVMLLFLQSWRAAIIPLAAVPVAIIGTFAAMSLLGYSLNNLTLFGLVLAVGIVVDDAIVVVEAVQHHIDHGMPPKAATARAMKEVAGPVVAVGLVLAAVFVPCVFISGIVGQFFRQFAVTIAVSTLLSAFNSLTLSPALCALLLRPGASDQAEPLPRLSFVLLGGTLAYLFALPPITTFIETRFPGLNPNLLVDVAIMAIVGGGLIGWWLSRTLNRVLRAIFTAFNRAFNAVTTGYISIVRIALRLSLILLAGYGGLLYYTYRVVSEAPSGFIPDQDKGYLLVNVQLADSSSLDRTAQIVRQVEEIARGTPGVSHTVAIAGQSVLQGANAANFGTVYVMLDPFHQRSGTGRTADAIAAELNQNLSDKVPGALVKVFGAPPVDGLGAAGGFTLMIQDPADIGPRALQEAGHSVVEAVADSPELRDAFSGYRADTPWLYLEIDRVAAKTMGVQISEIINSLQFQFGSLYVNDFNRDGRTWQVNVQAEGRFRRTSNDLKRLKFKSDNGSMVPFSAILSVKEVSGPVMLQRYQLYGATAVTVQPAAGISSGQAIAHTEEKAKAVMPPSMKVEWTELALLQLQTKDTAARAFVLAVILAFLVLAAQYESWALPLAVILVVPLCLLSATFGVIAAGLDVNIFTEIGFVVLVGLACKNAILIVEYAKQRRDAGADRLSATLEACELRFRPIVMTSVAFILGVVPLVVAAGAGAEMRRALGTAVFAGMIGVTLFGVFLTPVFYFSLQYVIDLRAPAKSPEQLATPEEKPGHQH